VTAFWAYFWPIFALGLVLGGMGGVFWTYRHQPLLLVIAAVLTLAGAAVWHGPLGAGDRLASSVDAAARAALIDWEMPQVQAHLHRGPLTRRLMLSGPADDFQRGQLVVILDQIPGVSRATWSSDAVGTPLIVEALLTSVMGFLAGLLLAYLVELRRRYNAQWTW
jgi:hypothetical protein